MLIEIIIATAIVSLVSLVSILFIFKDGGQGQGLKPLISLAAGALLATAFLDLLPEALEGSAGMYDTHLISGIILLSILAFFVLERMLHWHHCSDDDHGHTTEKHSIIWLNLIGDALHNILDGFLIAGAFMLDFSSGVLVTTAIILHEIPQEIFDFSILLYGGISRLKAVVFNLLISLTAMAAAVAFFFFGAGLEGFIPIVVATAVGNFIYLAVADIIPELHHENQRGKIVAHTLWLLLGVVLIYSINIILPHS